MTTTVRDLATLLRLRWRLLLRRNLSRYTRSAQSAAPVRLIVMAIVLIGFLAIVVGPLTTLLTLAVSQPQGRALLTLLLTSTSTFITVVIFFYALLGVVAVLTYGSDLKLLLLTPISPRVILAEKLLSVCGGFSLLLLAVGMPILVSAGQSLNLGFGYALAAAAVLIVMPVPPVSVAMLLVLLVLRSLPPARARSATVVLGTFLSALFYLGTQLLNTRAVSVPTSALRGVSAWSALPTAWPGNVLSALAATHSSTALAYLLAEVVLALLLAALAVEISARVFATGWATYQEVGRPSRRRAYPHPPVPSPPPGDAVRLEGGEKPVQEGQPYAGGLAGGNRLWTIGRIARPGWWPLVPKELLMLRRDPQRLAQLVYPLVIIGFLLYRTYARLPLAIGGNAALGTVFAPTLYIFLTLATVILLSAITLPVVNREGRSLYLLALAPLSARDILLSKWIVCVTPVLLLIEGILAAGAVLLQVEIVRALLIGLAMASLVVALGGAFLTVTLLWPRLEADNPRRQVSPAASFGALAVGVSLGGTVCLLLILTFVLWPLLPWLAIGTGLAIFLLTGAVTAAGLIAGSRLLQRLLGREYLMRPS